LQTFTNDSSRTSVIWQNLLTNSKEKKWKWKEHQMAFKKLKDKITSQLVLALPKRDGKFRVETNTSEHAIGGVLS